MAARDELLGPMGAFIMGRNMFGPIRRPRSDSFTLLDVTRSTTYAHLHYRVDVA